MREWIVSRWRTVLAGVAAIALAASIGVVALEQPSTSPAHVVDCSDLVADTFDEAAPLSDACSADVEVLSERTPWQTTWATDAGESRLDVTSLPSRVKVDGAWVPVDTSLVTDPKTGAISAAAPVFPIGLNPGDVKGTGTR